MRDLFDNGGVVGGTSAGCVGLSDNVMIMGGMSWDALRWGAYPYGSEVGWDDLVYDPDGGLGFFEGYVLDSHFRWNSVFITCSSISFWPIIEHDNNWSIRD